MAAPYDGQDPIVPNAYISGKGYWVVPNVAEDSEDRDAANFGVGVEGALDRTNWLAWRMVNGLEGGTYAGNITWTGTAVFSGSSVVFSGAYVQFSNEVLFSSADTKFAFWPKFNATKNVKRRAWRIAATTFDGASDTEPSGYCSFLSDAIVMRTRPAQVSTRKTVVEMLELPGNGSLVSVKIKVKGAIPFASGQVNPSFTLIEWAGNSAATSLSAAVLTTHVTGNWTTTVLESTVTPTTTVTIDKNKHYGVLIVHPYGSGADAAAWIYDFEASIDLTTIPQ